MWLSQAERDAVIYVCSDLQAANANFAVPRNARKVPDNASSFVVDGESLVIVSIQGCIVGGAAAGFTLSQVYNSVTTKIWQESTQGAGALYFEHHMWRPLTASILSGGTVINAAKLSLGLIGTPTNTSWLQIGIAINDNVRRRGKRTAVAAAYDGNSTS